MTSPPNLDLNLLATFARVVELGSFTAAAKLLGVPKSSVSRAVGRLEDSLGARLLQRTTRKLGLTEAGARYLAEVRGPLTLLAEATAALSEGVRVPRGLVRLSLPPEIGEGSLMPMLVDFVRAHPGIQIDLVVTNRRVSLVEEGIDLAIRAGKLDDSTLVARRVSPSEMWLFAAPDYLARRGRPRKLSDLREHDCINYRGAAGIFPWRLQGPRGVEEVAVNGPITADDFGAVRRLAIAGLGIALMPDTPLKSDLAGGRLVRVLPGYALRGPAVYVVSPPLRHVPARVSLLRDHLVRAMIAQAVV
jgi:DNA-binding transcriptional LysR family regulator